MIFNDNMDFKIVSENVSDLTKEKINQDFNKIISFIGNTYNFYRFDAISKYTICFKAIIYKYYYNNIDIKQFYFKLKNINPATDQLKKIHNNLLLTCIKLVNK